MSDQSTTQESHHHHGKGLRHIDTNVEVHQFDTNVEKTVHEDGHVDLVDKKAIGGEFQTMPKGYYTSMSFVMTFIAMCLASICAYLGWVLPANTL